MNANFALLVLIITFLSGAVAAQQTETPDEAEPTSTDAQDVEEAADESTDDPADEVIDEEGLDIQGFEPEDEDDFVPTEDIPTDQSIPFPTDI